MSKIAFLYPGQGAQVAGMGKDFYEKSPLAKEVFDKSCEILGQDMKHICFEENELLDRTDYTQAALVTTCMAMTKEIMARGLTPDMTAGLSLGEYCAITTAGGMELEDAIKMVWLRGNLMHNAVPEGKGGMAAVLGLSGEAVNEAIAYMEGVYVANYNCPGQIVITGWKEDVEQAADALKEAGAKRVLPLNVSGPFHSSLLEQAGEELGKELVIQNMDFDAVCLSVGQQKCDVAMAGLTVKKDRQKYVDFTDSYYDAAQRIIVKTDNTEFDNCKDAASIEKLSLIHI